jgi:hypothetical protein
MQTTMSGCLGPPPVVSHGQDGTASAQESVDDRRQSVHSGEIAADRRFVEQQSIDAGDEGRGDDDVLTSGYVEVERVVRR